MSSAESTNTDEPPVLVERRDRKLYVRYNRPKSLNAQNQPMRDIVTAAIAELEGDPELRVGIITGVGGRAFSAGADLREVARDADEGGRRAAAAASSAGPRTVPEYRRPNWNHFEAARWASKPLIAAIDGYCLGGGLEFANYCDVRIATEASTFGQPEPRTVGGTAGPALHQLIRALPMGEALMMQLTSQPMSASRAYELGLIQRLCPDQDALVREADVIADQMIQCDPEALRVIKRVVKWGVDMTSEQVEKLHFLADESRWAAMQDSRR